MDINLRMLGSSGGNARTSKLSSKHTSHVARDVVQRSSGMNGVQILKNAGRVTSGIFTGNLGKVVSSIPYVASGYMAIKGAERLLNFAGSVYASWSGEDMLTSNFKAQVKTIATGGLNIFSGSIRNEIFVKPRIMRENYMRDYNRELYGNIGYNDKNKLT